MQSHHRCETLATFPQRPLVPEFLVMGDTHSLTDHNERKGHASQNSDYNETDQIHRAPHDEAAVIRLATNTSRHV